MALKTEPMKHRFPAAHLRHCAAAGQHSGQQTGNPPASQLRQRRTIRVLTHSPGYTHQVAPITLDGHRGIMASAQVAGELTLDLRDVPCQSLALRLTPNRRLGPMKTLSGHSCRRGILRPTTCHPCSYSRPVSAVISKKTGPGGSADIKGHPASRKHSLSPENKPLAGANVP